jgi:hypothetical protein
MGTDADPYRRTRAKRNSRLPPGGSPNAGKHAMKKLMRLMTTRMTMKRKNNHIEDPLGKTVILHSL